MATIIFSNGYKKIVDYDKAATMYQMLQGNPEPRYKPTQAQEKYLLTVKEIIFDKTIPGRDIVK